MNEDTQESQHAAQKRFDLSNLQNALEKLEQRIAAVSERLASKEKLQLGYVYYDYPITYYKSWKPEGNALFSLLVNLSKRRRILKDKISSAESAK